MVLGCNDNSFHASVPYYPGPLAAVEGGRVEGVWTHTAFTPFLIGKCIHSEMNECVILQLLPFELLRRGHRQHGRRRRELHQKTQYEKYGLVHMDRTNCRAAWTITQSWRFVQPARTSAVESHTIAKGGKLMHVDKLPPMGVVSLHAKE